MMMLWVQWNLHGGESKEHIWNNKPYTWGGCVKIFCVLMKEGLCAGEFYMVYGFFYNQQLMQ